MTYTHLHIQMFFFFGKNGAYLVHTAYSFCADFGLANVVKFTFLHPFVHVEGRDYAMAPSLNLVLLPVGVNRLRKMKHVLWQSEMVGKVSPAQDTMSDRSLALQKASSALQDCNRKGSVDSYHW